MKEERELKDIPDLELSEMFSRTNENLPKPITVYFYYDVERRLMLRAAKSKDIQ